jgi:hypothetical protein
MVQTTKYAAFDALRPYFELVQKGLSGLVDGEHYFDTVADDAFFSLRLSRMASDDSRTGQFNGPILRVWRQYRAAFG